MKRVDHRRRNEVRIMSGDVTTQAERDLLAAEPVAPFGVLAFVAKDASSKFHENYGTPFWCGGAKLTPDSDHAR